MKAMDWARQQVFEIYLSLPIKMRRWVDGWRPHGQVLGRQGTGVYHEGPGVHVSRGSGVTIAETPEVKEALYMRVIRRKDMPR